MPGNIPWAKCSVEHHLEMLVKMIRTTQDHLMNQSICLKVLPPPYQVRITSMILFISYFGLKSALGFCIFESTQEIQIQCWLWESLH